MDLDRYFDEFTTRDWQQVTDEGPLRLAMIGIGWWTREQAIPAVNSSDLCATTVAVSSSSSKAQELRDNHPTIERGITYEEFHEGAAREAYDAVYICTPNAYHLPFVKTAASFEKAILCEKPMEASVERAEAMVNACENAHVPLMIAYRMHTEPAIRRARDLVNDGFIGEPELVHGHMTQPLLEMNPDYDQWRLDPERSGGATIMDLGIYPLNTARFVLQADPIAVDAMMDSRHRAFSEVPDEHAAFSVSFDDGTYAACSASQNAYQSSSLRIIGAEGELEINPAYFPQQPRSLTISRAGVTASHQFPQIDQMEEEFDYFADRVLSGAPIYPDGKHGLLDMKALNAIYRADDDECRITIQ